jgi:hypothetical protein
MNAERQTKLGNCSRRIKRGCMRSPAKAGERNERLGNGGILRFDCEVSGEN